MDSFAFSVIHYSISAYCNRKESVNSIKFVTFQKNNSTPYRR